MSYIDRELLLIGVDGCISALHVQAKGDPIQESAIKLVEATRDYIASLSAADVAEVVRCRECSKKGKSTCSLVLVQFGRNMKQVLVQKPVPDDFFCAYGQREEDNYVE